MSNYCRGRSLLCLLLAIIFLTSCAPGTAIPTPTTIPAATPAPTITPTSTPQSLADAPDLPTWVEEFVHAYGGKVSVNGVEMDADQLITAIRQNPDEFTQPKFINGEKYEFLVVNNKPLAYFQSAHSWQETTMKVMGNFAGIKIGSLIDDTQNLLSWWGSEYQSGTACISMADMMPNRSEIDLSWPNYQVRIAHENDMEARMQAVLFPGDMPKWMKNGFSQDDLDWIVKLIVENAKENHVEEIVVVNETGAPEERNDPYWEKFGEDYVIRAYQQAREIYPQAKLIYNDANNHRKGYITTISTLKLATDLKEIGLIDYVGVEMHLDSTNIPNKEDLIDVFQSYPVPVVITEFDALLTDIPESQRDAIFTEITRTVFDGCLEPNVSLGMTTWGNNDSVGWNGRTLLRDAENNRKQAYYVAIQSMFEHLP